MENFDVAPNKIYHRAVHLVNFHEILWMLQCCVWRIDKNKYCYLFSLLIVIYMLTKMSRGEWPTKTAGVVGLTVPCLGVCGLDCLPGISPQSLGQGTFPVRQTEVGPVRLLPVIGGVTGVQGVPIKEYVIVDLFQNQACMCRMHDSFMISTSY